MDDFKTRGNAMIRSNTRTSNRGQFLTSVLGETDVEWRSPDLVFEEIFLVEKEDDGRVCEPFVVADGVE